MNGAAALRTTILRPTAGCCTGTDWLMVVVITKIAICDLPECELALKRFGRLQSAHRNAQDVEC